MGTFVVRRIVRFAQDAEWAFILLFASFATVAACAAVRTVLAL